MPEDPRIYRGWFMRVYTAGRHHEYTGDARDMSGTLPDIEWCGRFGGKGAKKKALAALKAMIDKILEPKEVLP